MSVASAVGRLAVAHRALLAVCALFLLMGALVLDDYGISADERGLRLIGQAALDYLAGGGDRALDQVFADQDRYYGVAVEAPLVLVERLLGLESSRDIWLSRHMLTHLFFLAGGVFCYLLVQRMFGNRLLALIAMALFLLHPRIYAHSFFNSKDVPFLAMFMITLYLAHRAFRRDTLAAFLLCGVGVGLLVGLRIMGISLFAAVLALRGLDLALAGHGEARKRVLLTGGAFALGATLTLYGTLPVLWTDPVGRFAELVQTFGAHPNETLNLFRGEWLYSRDGPPLEYIPVWVGITTPPATLLLALAGGVALAWRGLRRPRAVLRNGLLRFGFLLLALPVVTVAGVVILESNVYNGWRLLYFLYAPLLLLAAFGLHWLAAFLHGRWLRVGACSLAGASVAVALVSMVRIHPLEDSYYNSLVDRTTPDHLVSQYETRYWRPFYLSLVRKIGGDHPEQAILVSHEDVWRQAPLLPEPEKRRISLSSRILPEGFYSDQPVSDREYTIKIYNNTLVRLVGRQLEHDGGKREAILRAALAGEPLASALAGEPLARSVFDIHRDGDMLVFVRDGYRCGGEEAEPMFVHLYPVDPDDLPDEKQQHGFDNRGFFFWEHGTAVDDLCIAFVPLPAWPIANIHAGQYDWRGSLWDVRFSVTPPEADSLALAGEPLARSVFDVWRAGGELIYVREGCTTDDAGAAFALHVYPVDPGDLPDGSEEYGFENRDFSLWQRGGRWRERCTAAVPLPDYPIASVQTGQYDETGQRWWVEFAFPDGERAGDDGASVR